MAEVTKDWCWFVENVYDSGRIGFEREETSKGIRIRVLAGNIAFDTVVTEGVWKSMIEPWANYTDRGLALLTMAIPILVTGVVSML